MRGIPNPPCVVLVAHASALVDEVRNFHSSDRFIPKDGSVPGG